MCSYGNISEAIVTRLREDINKESWRASNLELSFKTKERIALHLFTKQYSSLILINAEYAVIYLMT
jgi:hypothetical protein